METLLIGMRFVQFVAVMTLFGSSLFPFYAFNRTKVETSVRNETAVFVQRVALWASIAAILSALGWLACETVLMSGDANGYRDSVTILTVLNKTQFGRIWCWRLILLAVMPVYFALRIRCSRKPILWPIMGSGFLLVASLAGIGHGAMGTGYDAWIHLGNQAIHLLAASVWVGGLLSLFHIIDFARQSLLNIEALIHALKRFSIVGFIAVLLILASGGLNSWFLVGSIDALLHTTYGHVLMIKVLFFLCMVALALYNRLFVMPRLAHEVRLEKELRLLVRSIAVEQIFAVLVVASVSVLGMLPPAFNMDGMPM